MKTEKNRKKRRLKDPIINFIQAESSSGIILILCTVIAIILANSTSSEAFYSLTHTRLGEFVSAYLPHLSHFNMELFINDGLMAIFFFVVGLEIKREINTGNLSSARKAALPVVAAVGGMVVPALIYVYFNMDNAEHLAGWGVPMATDIAFALGILSLLGKRIPLGLKVFLSAVAIADDLGAVLVIAIFYTAHLNFVALAVGMGVYVIFILLNRYDVRNRSLYLFLGIIMWGAFLESGVHATIAGVLIAMAMPGKPRIKLNKFVSNSRSNLDKIEKIESDVELPEEDHVVLSAVAEIDKGYKDAVSPLKRIEHNLTTWVAFLIIPLFALVNAAVPVTNFTANLTSNVSVGVMLGLFIGKPIGVTIFTWLTVKFKIGELPKGVNWGHIIGASILAGIGFTMSFFIDNLAYQSQETKDVAKIGIMCASFLAAVAGSVFLIIVAKKTTPDYEN